MKNLIASLVLMVLFNLSPLAQTPTPTPPPIEDDGDVVKISTALIQIDVTVTDKNGKVINDLKPEEIEIYENGEKQEISNFSFVSNVKTIDPNAPPKSEKPDKNAVPPPSAQLKPEQVKRTVALVVDDLSLSFQSTYYVQRALKKFVNEQMQAGDLVAIIRTGAGIGALQQFTSDKRQLLAAIEKVRWNPIGSGGTGAFAPIESSPNASMGNSGNEDEGDGAGDGAAEFNNFRESVFATGTLGAVNYIVRGMKDLPGRKSVMLLSDGFQIFSRSAQGFSESTRVLDALRRLIDISNRSSVVIYTMDARGLQPLGLTAEDNVGGLSAPELEQNLSDRRNKFFDTQSGLISLAKETGGLAIYNNNDLSGGIEKMLDDQSYYLIGYQPDAETFDPVKRRFNKFIVKVKREGVRVRYRSGFFGIDDDKFKKPTELTAVQQIQTALTSPFAVNDVSLRLNTLFGNNNQGSFVRSLLHVNARDLKFVDDPDGSKKAVFDVLAVSFGDNGAAVDHISKTYIFKAKGETYDKIIRDGFVYHFSFPVKKAGAYQYRVAIRDAETNKVGSANQFIEVPNLKKNRLTVSGIVLDNLSLEQWERNANPPVKTDAANENQPSGEELDPMADTSLRRFKRGTILHYAFEIYNAKSDAAQKPNLTVQVKVFRDGKPLLEGKTVPVALSGQTDLQRIKSAGALDLGRGMTAGEYVMQIVVTDNLAKEKRRLAAQFVQFEIQE